MDSMSYSNLKIFTDNSYHFAAFPHLNCLPCWSAGRALDSGSENPGSSRSGARIALTVGMAGGLWQGPPEGHMKPVSGVDFV